MFYLRSVVLAALLAFPVLIFAVPKAGNVIFYMLLLSALFGIAKGYRPMGRHFGTLSAEYWPITLAMSSLVLAILIQQLASANFVIKPYDTPSRLASFVLIFWVFLFIPSQSFKKIEWSLIAGSIFFMLTVYLKTEAGLLRPSHILSFPLIPFGNIALLIGAFCVLTIGWNTKEQRAIILLKIAAGLSVLYGSYLSQSRGGWLAIPLFALILGALFYNRLRYKAVCSLIVIAACSSLYFLNERVEQRIDRAHTEMIQYFEGGNKNTSIGIRLQLWEGSWLLFKENPVLGVGRNEYPSSIQKLVQRQIVTPAAARHPHSHNDLLYHMATLGFLGLIAILSLYIVPAVYFFKGFRSFDRELKTISAMGLALCGGFFIFGLTDAMFYWRISYAFYGIFLAAIFAAFLRREASLKGNIQNLA